MVMFKTDRKFIGLVFVFDARLIGAGGGETLRVEDNGVHKKCAFAVFLLCFGKVKEPSRFGD